MEQIIIALVTTFGSVISGLLVQVIRQLSVLHTDVSALKAHAGIKVENGVAIPLHKKNGSAYELQK